MTEDYRSWRECPFAVGRRYLVRRDFEALRDRFVLGEALTFDRDSYSRYDAYTGYVFSQPGDPGHRVWDLHDDDDLESWRELFEEIPDDGASIEGS